MPTIFDADIRSLAEIGATARALAAKVRDGSITPAELAGSTFSVSNLGMYGLDSFSAVINPPQAAILAVGALKNATGRRRIGSRPSGDRRPPDGSRHPRLRPPDPLRRRRRPVPGAAAGAAGEAGGAAARLTARGPAVPRSRGRGSGSPGAIPPGQEAAPGAAVVGPPPLALGARGLRPSSTSTFSDSSTQAGGLRRQLDQGGEVDLVALESGETLDDLLGGGRQGHGHVHLPGRLEPEMEVLEQQRRGEGGLEVKVDVGRASCSG